MIFIFLKICNILDDSWYNKFIKYRVIGNDLEKKREKVL